MAHRRTNPRTFRHSIELREYPTEAEEKLWHALRSRHLEGVHFRRQHAIGHYVVDFCSLSHRLIVEVDGSQHHDQQEYDEERTAHLERLGFRVLRFWNDEVMNNPFSVVEVILHALQPVEEKRHANET